MMAYDDTDIQLVLDWWDLVDGWLNRKAAAEMSVYIEQLFRQMDQARNSGNRKKVWDVIERLKYLSEISENGLEIADVRLKCARVAVELGALTEAVKLLQEAAGRYKGREPEHSIATWLLGCVYWIFPGRQNDAIHNWQRSLAQFQEQKRRYEANRTDEKWYTQRCECMEAALRKAIDEDELPSLTLFKECLELEAEKTEPTEAPDQGGSAPDPGPQQTNPPLHPAVLQLYKIIEEIPAGGFGPTGFDPHTKGSVEVDRFTICGKPHRMVRLKNTGRIAGWKSDGYYVAKVTGDSMDREGIDKGDYVLLRQQVTADDQDIVAAVIVGFETSATLKRFIRRKGEIILRPNSTNPVHSEMVFSENDSGFEIHGVAVAVFKPA